MAVRRSRELSRGGAPSEEPKHEGKSVWLGRVPCACVRGRRSGRGAVRLPGHHRPAAAGPNPRYTAQTNAEAGPAQARRVRGAASDAERAAGLLYPGQDEGLPARARLARRRRRLTVTGLNREIDLPVLSSPSARAVYIKLLNRLDLSKSWGSGAGGFSLIAGRNRENHPLSGSAGRTGCRRCPRARSARAECRASNGRRRCGRRFRHNCRRRGWRWPPRRWRGRAACRTRLPSRPAA